jgi:hypothetical protein
VQGLRLRLEAVRRRQHRLGASGGLSGCGEDEGEGERVVVGGATADARVHPWCSSPSPRRPTSNRWRLGFGKLLDWNLESAEGNGCGDLRSGVPVVRD